MFYDYASYTASLDNGETPLREEQAVLQGLVLSQEIRSQIINSGDGYAVKTNTYAGLSYKKVVDGVPSNTKSSDIADPRQVMGLDESKVRVKKAWDVSLDPVQLTRFLAENKDYKAQLAVKNPEGDSVPVTIKADPVTKNPDGTYVSDNTKDVYIAPGVMLSEAKAIEKGVDLTKYPALTYDRTTYYLLETGHNYTMEESGSDWHFELDAQVYHPMVIDGDERDVSFTFDQSTGAITGITAIDMNNKATLTATNKLRSGVNIIKNVVDENGNDIDDDNTFYVRLTLKDKTGKEIKYSDYMRETDYSVGDNVVEKYQVDCGNGDSYWFIRANDGSGGRTYDYYALNENGTGQINGDLFPIWYNDYASYTEQNNVISGVGDWTLDSMWESGEVKAIKKGQLLQLKNVPYGTTVELTEVKPVRDGSGNITGYTNLSINNTFDGYKLLSVEYSHNGESWDKSIDFNNSYKIAVTNQAVGNDLYFRKADIASRGETDESRIVKLDGAEFELSRVRDNVSVRLYFDTTNGNKVMTQAEVEEKVQASASDADFDDKIEAAGISRTFIFNADGSDVSIQLPAGTYRLKETAPPSGYVITGGEMQFELTSSGVTVSGSNISSGTKDEKPLITVYNEPGPALPSTGGPGTGLITSLGSIMTLLGSGILWRRRR